MGILIDTSVLVAVERGDLALQTALALMAPGENYFVSAMTVAELLHGVHRVAPTKRAKREEQVERLIREIPTIPFDNQVARVFARLDADLQAVGMTIATADLIIAATAVAYGHGVLTRDLRSFPRVPDLKVWPV